MSAHGASHASPLRKPAAPAEAGEPSVLGREEIFFLLQMLGLTLLAWLLPYPPVKYMLIGLLGLMALIHTHRRPALGLALLAFFMPAIDLMPAGLIPIRGVNAETLLILFALYIWHRANLVQGREGIRTRLGLILLAYACLIAFSCVNGWIVWGGSLFDLLAQAKNHLVYMLFLPVALHTLRDRRDQVFLVLVCTISLSLNALQAIQESWLPFFAGTLDRHRASAVLALQPNIFGGAMALYLPAMVVLGLNRIGSRGLRRLFLVSAGLLGFALILTLSRGAWLGAVVGLLAVAVMRNRKLLLLLILMGASYQFWVPEQAVDRAQVTLETKGDIGVRDQIVDDSTQMRLEQYKSFPRMVAPRPLFGWGYKSFPEVFGRLGTLGREKGGHSTYLLVGVEEGLLGLGLVIVLFIALALFGMRASREIDDPLLRWLAVGVFGGAVAMAITMGSGARYEAQKVFTFYWIFVGLLEREVLLRRGRRAGAESGGRLRGGG